MEYISTKEASKKWGISAIRITVLANEGRIPGAKKLGRSWLIPAGATKPVEFKRGDSALALKANKDFSFPLYHFHPDRNNTKELELSNLQQILLQAEGFVLECRFEEAFPLLDSLLEAASDVITEICCLFLQGICCITLNKLDVFFKIYMRLKFLLSEDFPNRNDMNILLNILNTYIDTVDAIANSSNNISDIHYQSLPLACVYEGYSNLAKEFIKTGTANINLLEINLKFLETTSAVTVVEMMHCYLLGIYHIRNNLGKAQKHAEAMLKIAYENKIYFPVVFYYSYYSQIFAPILENYPEEFKKLLEKLGTQCELNYRAFLASLNKDSVLSAITDADYPYIFGVLTGLSNDAIAERIGVHPHTVNNRISKLCKRFHVDSKKELRSYLRNYL